MNKMLTPYQSYIISGHSSSNINRGEKTVYTFIYNCTFTGQYSPTYAYFKPIVHYDSTLNTWRNNTSGYTSGNTTYIIGHRC